MFFSLRRTSFAQLCKNECSLADSTVLEHLLQGCFLFFFFNLHHQPMVPSVAIVDINNWILFVYYYYYFVFPSSGRSRSRKRWRRGRRGRMDNNKERRKASQPIDKCHRSNNSLMNSWFLLSLGSLRRSTIGLTRFSLFVCFYLNRYLFSFSPLLSRSFLVLFSLSPSLSSVVALLFSRHYTWHAHCTCFLLLLLVCPYCPVRFSFPTNER